ncbi:MAG: dephospho-CoA kinase [Chloroflexi bacterium]|nr:dephospho-CoA kinase [Chloroflexota bacterium]
MIIAGITGTIGTGKSTVAKMFQDLGAYIIDADALARKVEEPGQRAWQKIVDQFGDGILNRDKTINRQKLADIVFSNPQALQKLNSIVHPEVLREDTNLIEERRKVAPDGLVVKDIPLLLEVGPEIARRLVDKIIVVFASPEIQLKRLIARGVSEEDARNRIRNQIPIKEKMKFADYVINNDGTLEETRQQVQVIYDQLMSR